MIVVGQPAFGALHVPTWRAVIVSEATLASARLDGEPCSLTRRTYTQVQPWHTAGVIHQVKSSPSQCCAAESSTASSLHQVNRSQEPIVGALLSVQYALDLR